MEILRKPHNTEKMTLLAEKSVDKQYAFQVDRDASKPAIKAAIEALYGVKVDTIRTMVVRGKKRTRYSRMGFIQGQSNTYKKAIVTLRDGQTIDFYKNIN